jgi:hypothetical protein
MRPNTKPGGKFNKRRLHRISFFYVVQTFQCKEIIMLHSRMTLMAGLILSQLPAPAHGAVTEVCSSIWPSAAQSYLLIYLDSTDGSLSVDTEGLQLSFRDPWGSDYKRLAWQRATGHITVREAPAGVLLEPIVLHDIKADGYQNYLNEIIGHTSEFMWGYGAYTIGEPPTSPLNPELQEALTCLESLKK